MKAWFGIARRVDQLTQRLGRLLSWLAVVMVLIGAFNALGRYASRALGANPSSNGPLEAQWYLFASSSYSAQRRRRLIATSESTSTTDASRPAGKLDRSNRLLVLMLPFCIFAFATSLSFVGSSWAVWEVAQTLAGCLAGRSRQRSLSPLPC